MGEGWLIWAVPPRDDFELDNGERKKAVQALDTWVSKKNAGAWTTGGGRGVLQCSHNIAFPNLSEGTCFPRARRPVCSL